MRIVKNAVERKNEILDTADRLFGEKGFDGTSTNDILERVGIARGTLYHHFKSKEEIMDALIERYHTKLLEAAREAALQKEIPVLERVIRTVMALKIRESSGLEMAAQMKKPQNALMQQKVQRMIIISLTPILVELIREGMEENLFHTEFPYECMEMIVVYAIVVFDGELVILSEAEQLQRVNALISNMECLLGMEKGALSSFTQLFTNESGGRQDESDK